MNEADTPLEAASVGAPSSAAQPERSEQYQDPVSPAREMSLHVLRMMETRMEAAGIALQSETQMLLSRLQLKLLAAAAVFIAIWGGIVLLAIALPAHLRIPVLSAVVIGFVVLAIAAYLYAGRRAVTHEVGSLHWFLDSLRQDLEVVSRTLARNRQAPATPDPRRDPHDLAA